MVLCYLKPPLVSFTPSRCWHPNGNADVAHLRRLDRLCVERFLRRQPSMIDRELVNRS